MTQQANKPETIRDGNLKSTIWTNENDKGTYHTVTLARTYQDAEGNYKDTQTFSQNDMLKLSVLTYETYQRINKLKREQNRGQDNDREVFKEKRQSREDSPQRDAPSHDR